MLLLGHKFPVDLDGTGHLVQPKLAHQFGDALPGRHLTLFTIHHDLHVRTIGVVGFEPHARSCSYTMPNEGRVRPAMAAITVRTLALVGVLCAMLVITPLLASCSGRERGYSQDTPDDVVRSAVAMVKSGDTSKLSTLIYADSPEMRAVLRELGKLLKSMQTLSVAAAKAFPQDFAALQEQAAAAAADPKNKSLITQVMVGLGSTSGGPTKQPNADDIRNAFSAVLADPYGWLERNSARLSTVTTSDETAAVLFDNEPAIPVVGLPMKKEDGKWYVFVPTKTPPLSTVMPRTRAMWSILGSVIRVTDNAVKDLTVDVNAGRVASIKNLTDKFQEKVLFTVAIAFGAYARELDVYSRIDRRMSQLRTRQREWVETKKKNAPKGDAGVSTSLTRAVLAVAPAEIERVVRKNKPLGIDKLSDREFEDLAAEWLKAAGLVVAFDKDLNGPDLDAKIAAWEQQRAAEAKKKAEAEEAKRGKRKSNP